MLTRIALAALAAPLGLHGQSSDIGWGTQVLPDAWPPTVGVGHIPRLLSSADLDGDGRRDVLYDGGQTGLRVAPGLPGGAFDAPQPVLGIPNPWLAEFADLDHDGLLDAIQRPATSGGLLLHRGVGGGAFGAGVPYSMSPLGTDATANIAIGDLDSDGWLDVVSCDTSARVLTVRRGLGGGQLGPASFTSLAGYPGRLTLGDVDNDGALDVLAEGAVQTSRFGLLLGDGLGGFAPAIALSIFANPNVLRDVDGDGNLDLAVATQNGATGSVRVFRGDGAGGFALASATPWTAPLHEITLGDFDGDRELDVAAAESTGVVVTLHGLGNLMFAAPRPLAIPPCAGRLLATDLDSDGIDDLLALGSSGTVVLYGSHLRGLVEAREEPLAAPARSLSPADFDGDGDTDVLLSRALGAGWAAELLVGDGNGGLALAATVSLPFEPSAVALGDVDADGRIDAVVASLSGAALTLVRGAAGATLASPQPLAAGSAFTSLACGDFNADGFADVAALDSGALTLHVLSGSNAPPSNVLTIPLPASAIAVKTGDLDGDGIADVVVATDAPSLCWLRGSVAGLGALQQFTLPHAPNSLDVARIDGDSRADVVVGTESFGPLVRLGSAAGPLAELVPGPGLRAQRVHAADVDGDGRADLAFDLALTGTTVIVALRGTVGGFESPSAWGATQVAGARALADLDGDGALEALCAEPARPVLRVSMRRKGPRYESYCAAGTSVAGCVPHMLGLGTPTVSAGGGPTLLTQGLDGQRSALVFWGTDRPIVQPWAPGGTSLLCLAGRLRRSPLQFTFGTSGACDGTALLDANAEFIAAGLAAGQLVYAQTWYRDPLAPKGSQLSNALAFALDP